MWNLIFLAQEIGWKFITSQNDQKVRHFRVTLIGEARLWYESLDPQDNEWPTLKNKFRWQYSKIG